MCLALFLLVEGGTGHPPTRAVIRTIVPLRWLPWGTNYLVVVMGVSFLDRSLEGSPELLQLPRDRKGELVHKGHGRWNSPHALVHAPPSTSTEECCSQPHVLYQTTLRSHMRSLQIRVVACISHQKTMDVVLSQ